MFWSFESPKPKHTQGLQADLTHQGLMHTRNASSTQTQNIKAEAQSLTKTQGPQGLKAPKPQKVSEQLWACVKEPAGA